MISTIVLPSMLHIHGMAGDVIEGLGIKSQLHHIAIAGRDQDYVLAYLFAQASSKAVAQCAQLGVAVF